MRQCVDCITPTWRIKRSEILDPARIKLSREDAATLLKPNSRIPIDGKPLTLLAGKSLPADPLARGRALYDIVKKQGRDGALGIVQGEHALGRIEFTEQAGVKTNDPEVQPGVEPPPAEG